MRVMITGAGGQLGQDLISAFDDGEVLGLDRERLDVTDRAATFAITESFRPDVVVHAAAFTDVDGCETDPDRAFLINGLGTRHVAEAAYAMGAITYYLSTDYVFDGILDRSYNEWDDTNPMSVYGKSKRAGELELNDRSAVIRTSWMWGPNRNNIVKTILKLAKSKGDLFFVDDQRGCPTLTTDLAGAIRRLAQSRMTGTFHITNQGATTWYQFAQAVMKIAGLDPKRVKPVSTGDLKPARLAPRPANSVLDNMALRLTGIPLLPDYHDALERVVPTLLEV